MEGDAHVVRNAGGRASDDAIRSLVISCHWIGVAGTTRAKGQGGYINWLTFSDNAKSVVEDVTRIRTHPLVPNDIPIYGYIYDVKSGKLIEVPEAMTVGEAS